MNKFEYLSKLKGCLSSLPAKERKEAVRYYEELFNDAGSDNEQTVISNLGSPQKLAHTILNDDNGISYALNQTKKGVKSVRKKLTPKQTAIAVILIILTLPIWGGILLAIAGVVLALFAASAITLVAILISGIALICMGVAYLINTTSIALVLIGVGLSLGSITFLLFMPIMNLVFNLLKLIIKGLIKLFNKIVGKTEAIA